MRSRIVAVVFALVAACGESPSSVTGTNPPPPPSPVFASGTWHSAWIPSGAATILTLQVAGDSITGMDHEYGLMSVDTDSGTVSGQYVNGVATLTIRYASRATASFSGHMFFADTLDGTWTPAPPQAPWARKLYFQRN